MKLRSTLFLIFGGMFLLLFLLQWWVMSRFNQNIRREVETTAFEISRDTATAVVQHQIKVRVEQKGQKQRQIWAWQTKTSGASPTFVIKMSGDKHAPAIRLIAPGLDQRIAVPHKRLQVELRGYSTRLLLALGAVLLSGLVLAAFFAHRLARPLARLSAASEKLAHGALGIRVNPDQKGTPLEVRTALAQFNRMSAELARLEQENHALLQRQQLGELGDISRGFAHSLRNPLNTLGLAIDELSQPIADASLPDQYEQREHLRQTARRQIERIDRWIQQFTALSQQDRQASKVIALRPLLEALCGEIATSASRVTFQNEIPSELSISGSELELRAMLQVVLENAVEASPAGGVVRIWADSSAAEHCHIGIDDQGQGVDEVVQERLFKPRVTTKDHGSGMGLYLARRIARACYSGELTLHSRVALEKDPGADPAAQPQGSRARLTLGARYDRS